MESSYALDSVREPIMHLWFRDVKHDRTTAQPCLFAISPSCCVFGYRVMFGRHRAGCFCFAGSVFRGLIQFQCNGPKCCKRSPNLPVKGFHCPGSREHPKQSSIFNHLNLTYDVDLTDSEEATPDSPLMSRGDEDRLA